MNCILCRLRFQILCDEGAYQMWWKYARECAPGVSLSSLKMSVCTGRSIVLLMRFFIISLLVRCSLLGFDSRATNAVGNIKSTSLFNFVGKDGFMLKKMVSKLLIAGSNPCGWRVLNVIALSKVRAIRSWWKWWFHVENDGFELVCRGFESLLFIAFIERSVHPN